jgi:hypothetical protein
MTYAGIRDAQRTRILPTLQTSPWVTTMHGISLILKRKYTEQIKLSLSLGDWNFAVTCAPDSTPDARVTSANPTQMLLARLLDPSAISLFENSKTHSMNLI